MTGPLLKKKGEDGVEKSILGFRFSGRYRRLLDDDPPAAPIFRVTDEKLAELEANPIVANTSISNPFGGPSFAAAGMDLVNEDVEAFGYRPNEENQVIDLTAKIDARLSDDIDVSFTGAINDTRDRFTPGFFGGSTWQILNSHNNPTNETRRYRGNIRFRHKLGRQSGDETNSSIIQNAFYTLQGGFDRGTQNIEDDQHGCLLYTSPSPRDRQKSRMPSSA